MNAVVFDFDGTLADSFDIVLSFLLEQAGRSPDSVGSVEREQLKNLSMLDLALAAGIPRWKLVMVYFRGRSKLRHRMRHIVPFPGIEAVLAALRTEDYQLYILSSNSRRNISQFLSEHGLGGYFQKLYGSAGWFGKAGALRRLLKQNNLDAADTVYIGDETRDVIGAKLVGMPSIAVSWGFGSEDKLLAAGPTVLVRRPAELEKTLVEWGKTV